MIIFKYLSDILVWLLFCLFDICTGTTSLHLIFKETYHAHKTVPSNQDSKHSRQPHNDLHDDSHYENGMCLEWIKILIYVWSRKYIIQIQKSQIRFHTLSQKWVRSSFLGRRRHNPNKRYRKQNEQSMLHNPETQATLVIIYRTKKNTTTINTHTHKSHSWLITGFVTRLKRRVSPGQQELLTLPEYLS
jgi:hypothetical protein